MKRALTILLLLAAMSVGHAQTDTIAVTGTVYNQHTQKPEPYCLVQLVQDSIARAVRVCDGEGFFLIDSLPTGVYTLRVGVGRATLFQNDFELRENANLSIYVDTLQLINLRAVSVTARRWVPPLPAHRLEELHLLISDADDYRLWNFGGEMTDSGPACADLSRGSQPGLQYQAEVEKKKSYRHLWYTDPIPATPRRKPRLSPTPPADSTAHK
ncbi:MAG: hypothetical protein IJ634_06605 [Bacteroidales bacterium]|nr:hypothetical protein [Bacteroidales bacterium]